ncbi:MAG: VWA domain-containing protein [Burkholderiales bacterium]|nr:VWA domain-containing protein [Burkholderiales bacterium]
MTFQWPGMLWLLLAVPFLVAGYAWLTARGRRMALAYAGLTMADAAAGARTRFRRHAPGALLLLGVAAMLFGVARPQAPVTMPSRQQAVILVMDVSGSMRATDLKPNRLAAAQAAAKLFIANQPRHVRVGIVAVAGAAALVQSPTDSRDELSQAIDRFQLQRGSAVGSGLLMALATLVPEAGIDVEQLTYGARARPWLRDAKRKAPESKPVPPGSNGSVAIVLLSDGESNTGFDPLEAAKLAADHGVRVHTIGMGTAAGTTLGFDGWSMRVRLNDGLLKKISAMTEGEYFQAAGAEELKGIYGGLATRIALEKTRTMEVTALFVGAGIALALAGALVSLFRSSRIL